MLAVPRSMPIFMRALSVSSCELAGRGAASIPAGTRAPLAATLCRRPSHASLVPSAQCVAAHRFGKNGPMPEGDTIFRTAALLRAALRGHRVTAARAQPGPGLRRVPDLSPLVGTTVTAVEARGKHLLISFDNGLTLRSHLRMRGSWHRYRPGERWRLPATRATVVLETTESVAVAFDTPVVELLTDAGLRRSQPLRELGPDLLGPDFDAGEALRRLRERDALEL